MGHPPHLSHCHIGGESMKKQEIKAINEMRLQGKSPAEIACRLNIPVNTIRTHIRRHPEICGGKPCKSCGKLILQPPGRKEKLFCSDKCRMAWWNSHRDQVRKNAFYTIICSNCRKEFTIYGKKDRKYCCRDCYLQSRKSCAAENIDAISSLAGIAGYHVA